MPGHCRGAIAPAEERRLPAGRIAAFQAAGKDAGGTAAMMAALLGRKLKIEN
jgi:hypothetical protein